MNDEVERTMIDKGMVMKIVRNENWRKVRKYLSELKEDLREGFEKLNECLTCPANTLFCSEVARLVESYDRALLATLMLKCLLNDALGVVEDGELREELNEVLKVTNDLIVFLNEKHELVHQLVRKCRSVWGDPA
jgi:hypothetical protein